MQRQIPSGRAFSWTAPTPAPNLAALSVTCNLGRWKPLLYNFPMTQEARELLQKALALPDNERAELAGNLISSLDGTVDPDVDAAWQQEVVRRLHEVQSGKVGTISWEEVQQKGRTLLHGKSAASISCSS